MRNQRKVINYESAEAASIQTVTGWVSSNGSFWGKDEHMARYVGSTHRLCEKKAEHGAHETRGWCTQCHEERARARYDAMPRKDYDGSPIAVYDGEDFFFDEDALRDWLVDNEIAPEHARLVFCVPNKAAEIDPCEHFVDDLPEDGDESVFSARLLKAFEALNAAIREEPPLSWREGDVAVVLPANFLE